MLHQTLPAAEVGLRLGRCLKRVQVSKLGCGRRGSGVGGPAPDAHANTAVWGSDTPVGFADIFRIL